MAKRDGKVARRYARALMSLYEPKDLEAASQTLSAMTELWNDNEELHFALKNPAIPLAVRSEIAKESLALVGPNATHIAQLLVVLLDNGRIDFISQISDEFARMVEELKKILSLEVRSAFPVDAAERAEFEGTLTKEYGGMVSIDWEADKSLIGGMLVKIGDRLLDSSLSGALQKMREELYTE